MKREGEDEGSWERESGGETCRVNYPQDMIERAEEAGPEMKREDGGKVEEREQERERREGRKPVN